MANKNIVSPTAARIYAAWEREGRAEAPRTYLGASIIGHECDMYLWLNFRGVVREKFDGRMYRLFDRGKREESVFCDDLRRIGCEVREFDESGNQWAVSDYGDHFSGHLDGLARGLGEAPKQWFVVEFKTHSDASFKKLCKEGVAVAKKMHYVQMQVYMGKTGLKKALYMAVNKDNDDLWVETVNFNKTDYDLTLTRAKHIIDTTRPDRCAKRPDDYKCKMCPCAYLCWNESNTFIDPSVPETCRTCCHSTADTENDGANWVCSKGHSCSRDGKCSDYLILPALVNGEIVEGDDSGIVYSYEADGKSGQITIGERGFSVYEAKKFGPKEAESVKQVKNSAPGSFVSGNNKIKFKYTSDKFSEYFSGTQEEMMRWNDPLLIDMTKPIASEEDDESKFYEYDCNWCIAINKRTNIFTVYGETPPF